MMHEIPLNHLLQKTTEESTVVAQVSPSQQNGSLGSTQQLGWLGAGFLAFGSLVSMAVIWQLTLSMAQNRDGYHQVFWNETTVHRWQWDEHHWSGQYVTEYEDQFSEVGILAIICIILTAMAMIRYLDFVQPSQKSDEKPVFQERSVTKEGMWGLLLGSGVAALFCLIPGLVKSQEHYTSPYGAPYYYNYDQELTHSLSVEGIAAFVGVMVGIAVIAMCATHYLNQKYRQEQLKNTVLFTGKTDSGANTHVNRDLKVMSPH